MAGTSSPLPSEAAAAAAALLLPLQGGGHVRMDLLRQVHWGIGAWRPRLALCRDLLAWAQEVAAVHRTFVDGFLRGTLHRRPWQSNSSRSSSSSSRRRRRRRSSSSSSITTTSISSNNSIIATTSVSSSNNNDDHDHDRDYDRLHCRRRLIRPCHLPVLPGAVLTRVAALLGVETGRRLRNAREFRDAMETVVVEVAQGAHDNSNYSAVLRAFLDAA